VGVALRGEGRPAHQVQATDPPAERPEQAASVLDLVLLGPQARLPPFS
jgi:hypothetical protein